MKFERRQRPDALTQLLRDMRVDLHTQTLADLDHLRLICGCPGR